nr:uncharacterized protein LOC129261749 [Lytechinus pictus]
MGICRGRTRRCRKGGRCRRRARRELHESQTSNEVTKDSVTLALWNARSLNNKTHMFCDLMINNRVDIAAITETWFTGDHRDDIPLAHISSTLQSYIVHHVPREGRLGGGVAVCVHQSFKVKRFQSANIFTSFEYMDVLVTAHGHVPVRLLVVYRPQRTASGQSTDQLFLQEFSTLMEQLVSSTHQLLIVGDFNYHVDIATDSNSVNFLNDIAALNLQQHVHFPTHKNGHTLDLVLTRANEALISNVSKEGYLPSDHVAVTCTLNIRKPKPQKVQIRTRKIQNIDLEAFRQDILVSELYSTPSDTIDGQVDRFESTLSTLLDKHAPVVTRVITSRPESPWYGDDLRELKRELRVLERKAFPRGLEIDRERFRKAAHHYSNKLISAKSLYHRNQLRDCTPRELFKKIERLTQPTTSSVIPSINNCDSVAECFVNFFKEKVTSITDQLKVASSATSSPSGICFGEGLSNCKSSFTHFKTVSDEEVRRVIMQSSTSTCDLDPILTSFLKQLLPELVPIMTEIINESFCIWLLP